MRAVSAGGLAGMWLMTAAPRRRACATVAGREPNNPVSPFARRSSRRQGQCVPAVDYAGTAAVGPNVNPLYDTTLRNIWLGTPSFGELESFRKLLEAARKGVERDRKASLQAFARREIDRAAADQAAKRYETAIVNYYLGLQAYRDAFRDM